MRPIALVGMVAFVIAISLTKCRLALLGFGLGLFSVGFFLFRNKYRDASPGKTILGGVVIAAGVALCLTLMWQFGSYASAHELFAKTFNHLKRPFSRDLLHGTGRFRIWSHIPGMMRKYAPISYLFGIDDAILFPLIYDTLGKYHIHSGYFSALLLMGIPGFLMTLVFLFKTVKDVFYIFLKMKTHVISLDNILLLSFPACFLFAALGEPILFAGYNFIIITLVFYLVSGYIFELAERLRKEELSLPTAADGEVQPEAH